MKKKNYYLALFSFGMVYGTMYNLPYVKNIFYDAMIECMGINNTQIGFLLTCYAIACIVTYVPGGWIADRFAPKKILVVSGVANGLLSILFAVTMQSFTISILVWILCALTGSAQFWAAILKAVRLTGGDDEQGKTFGIFDAFCGVAATLTNFACLWVFSLFTTTAAAFRWAIVVMGLMSIVGAGLVAWLYKENVITDNSETGGDDNRLTLASVWKLLKTPGVYLSALVVFTVYSVWSGQSYLNPYFTNVLGASVVFSGALSVVRTYGLKMLGGPVGGVIADKVGAVSKLMVGGSIVSIALIATVLVFPTGMASAVLILTILTLILAAVNFMLKGTMFATVSEVEIPKYLTGSAVGIVTLLGWTPDLFMSTLFGSWLDKYGDGGYRYIFIYLIGMCVLCIATNIAIMVLKKMKKDGGQQGTV